MIAATNRLYKLLAAGLVAVTVSTASADTIATFADPSLGPNNPLFELSGNKLNGGWSDLGLTLIVPVTGMVYPNATFTMTELTWDGMFGLSGGTLKFFDAGQQMVLQIDFDKAMFYWLGFGADGMIGANVTMTGPGIPSPLYEESFAFSFANQRATPTGYTWTASFTSSAVPEPSSLLLVGLGAWGLVRRRS